MIKPLPQERAEEIATLRIHYADGMGFVVVDQDAVRGCLITHDVRPTFTAVIEIKGQFYVFEEQITVPEYIAWSVLGEKLLS